jgi:hypothetical protein
VVRAETALELGRIAILRRDASGARRALAGQREETAPYLRAMAILIDAAADVLDGNVERARARLDEAIALADDTGMPWIAALARRRSGALRGALEGDRLIAAADAQLRALGVVTPERFARVFATWPTT